MSSGLDTNIRGFIPDDKEKIKREIFNYGKEVIYEELDKNK